MQLTPEQQKQVEKAKAAGEKRVIVRYTAEQKAEWQKTLHQELDGKEKNIAHLRKIKAAAAQSGFFGDARRAIVLSGRPVDELAKAIGVAGRLLSDFRAGEAELPSEALDRLLDLLGLRIMLEIRR